MSQKQRYELEDTFNNWLLKHNLLVDSVDKVDQNFGFNSSDSVGRVIKITAGKIRNSSVVVEIAQTVLTLTPNASSVVGVTKVGEANVVQQFLTGAQPTIFFVPLYNFVTDAYNVTSFKDLRTQVAYSSGGTTPTAPGVLLFKRNITENMTIPTDQNALSLSPVIAPGVEVTVSADSEWVIL